MTKIDLSNFDFDQFKQTALEQLKQGHSLTGKEGILTPLINMTIGYRRNTSTTATTNNFLHVLQSFIAAEILISNSD